MWEQNQNNSNFRKFLIVAEILVIAIIVIALANFLWQNTAIGYLDQSLQIAFGALLVLAIVFAANYILDRRW